VGPIFGNICSLSWHGIPPGGKKMRMAPPVVLSAEDREQLERLARGRKLAARVVERARIVLLAAEGKQNQEIARICRVTRRIVGVWRHRFAEKGIAGILKDAPRAGRRRSISDEVIREIVRVTMQETPVGRNTPRRRRFCDIAGHRGVSGPPQRDPEAIHLDENLSRHP